MENIEVLDFKDFYILISKVNGNTLTVDESVFNDKAYLCDLLIEYKFFEDIEVSSEYNKELFKTIYISLHTSSKCNMSCTYCFKKDRDDNNLTFDKTKRFIDMIIDEYPNDLSMMDDATPYEHHSWASESRNQDGIPGKSENFYTHIIKVGVWYIYQEYYYIYYYEWEDVETVSSNDFTDNKITVEILFSDAYLYYPATHWSSPPNPSFEFTSSKGYLEHVRKIHSNYLFITDFELVYTCDSTISNFSVMHFSKSPNYTPNLISFLGNKFQHKITSSILGPIQTVLDLGYELIDLYSTKDNSSTYEDPNQTDVFGDWSVGQSVSSIVIYDTNETIYGDYIDIVQQGSSVNPNRGERVVFTINPHDSNDINYEKFKMFYEFYFYIDIDSSDSDEIRFNRSHYFNDTNAKTHSVTLGTC